MLIRAAPPRGISHPHFGRMKLHRFFSARAGGTIFAALVERIPILTPELPAWRLEIQDALDQRTIALSKAYPAQYTEADEGPDRRRAREKLLKLIECDGSRLGEGDHTDDKRSLDRQLTCRLYLLLQINGRWQFPQVPWEPDASNAIPNETIRSCLLRGLAAQCGDYLDVHWMGNAPLAHLVDESRGTTSFFLAAAAQWRRYRAGQRGGGLQLVDEAGAL
eukprot:CAMPEP_0119299972 /NCGR_PEP_ID=MMETSP1333-20130426/1981_1 /TAXON_ID=418940 /ORGANISM="Scyphosphaera apsteinii, Strain RCC1455" /LENGTH=219 /DNA_ID=CAMNT_0007301581 /DNA_START=97 /DNA_END=756 /DNA_ORIENTATION=-